MTPLTAVSEMSRDDKRLHGQDESLERYVKATVMGRGLLILRAFELRERLAKCRSAVERDTVLEEFAEASGRKKWQVEKEAAATEFLNEEQLVKAFAAESITPKEWQERLWIEHLQLLGQAKKGHRLLTSTERVGWLKDAYHQNWGADQLKVALIEAGLLPKPKGAKSVPVPKAPAGKLTTGQMLITIGQYMLSSGHDVDASLLEMDITKPKAVHALLKAVADMYPRICGNRSVTVLRETAVPGREEQTP